MSRFFGVGVSAMFFLVAAAADAQWLKLKTPDIPRSKDGKPNLTAPAPRSFGRPDFSGLWRFTSDPYSNNVTVDLKPEDIEPSIAALYKQRLEDLGKDDPATFRCLPSGPRQIYAPTSWVRIVQTPTLIVMLYEDLIYRTIFMDGRELPRDPSPSMMGYSVGRWDGDTLVIDSIGFKDATWLDFGGHAHSEALKLTERIRRGTFGRLDLEVRIEDLAFYKRAWKVPVHAEIVTDTEMLEYVCNENQKDTEHLVGKASDEKKLAVKVAAAILSGHVGSYTFIPPDDPNQKMRFNVTLAGEALSLDIGGKDKQEMIPLGETTFSMMGIRIDFVVENGVTTHLIFHIVEGDMRATRDR